MKKESPDDKEINLEEQKAPLKNTDNAFVIVSENGSPVMPEVSKGSKEKKDIQASVADKRQE